jgi:DNA-binding response OmpR family regulator
MNSILVVDDEYDIAQAIRGILEDEGFEVEVCSNGRHALQCIKEKDANFKLILIDVMMPFMSGLDLLKQLRSDRRFTKVPVVLMNNTELKVNQSEHQWDGFLRKPFDCKSLLNIVTRFTKDSD